ncbi:transcription intermediary factor 1-beta-like isoform X2 [Anguilla anguilla]|uniref:transcription intermediary factor 1-beta-like isoform X2 n=1 Tax=Anguilla anguilla TaxID=7936 RepID=UPI0015A81406|nr:transcription intermediary factor 1-beta-like isoform X2 [Anguilla anguilla]
MDAMSSATFSTVEEHCDTAEVSATRPAACFGNCAACGTKLVPDGCPQLLPCLHSLCQKCVCVDRRECPVCGAVYTPTEVIDNLFFKKSQQTTQCGGCGGAGAGGWCVECGEALCPECVSAHKRVKVTREHAVLPQKPPTVSAPTLYCSTHREERVKLICQLCDQATCRECQLTLHRNHRFQFLHEAVAEEKGQIRSVMEDLRLQRQEVRRSLSDLDRRLLDVKDLHNKLNGELRDTILRVRDALLKRAMTLAAEVQEQCGSEKRSVLERQEVLKKLEERQTYLLSFTERALDTEGYSTLLSCRRKIQSQLRDVMSHAVSPGDCMMNLTFHCAQDTYGHMATFGQVVVEKVPFACTNNENAIGKNPHLHKNQTLNSQVFFTTETPPTSSPNPPTYCDNSLTSSHKSAASALSASFQTSRTLNSNTSTHDLTISCHNLPTLSSSQIQTAFSHISTTSSGNPPTSSGNPPTSSLNPSTSSGNPPTSSLNPSTSSAKGPSLSQMLCPSSYRPIGTPAVSHTAISPCHSIADIYNSNLSSRAVMLPCLLSTFPLSLPVALYSVSLNAAPTIPIPLTPNGQMANANTPAIQTSASSPCSQISQTVAQAAILPEAQGSSESMPLDTVVGLAASTEDQTANGTFLAPPVKALADSPCERTPPAGGAQEEPVNPAAAENEPTSTVVEADITECAGDPSEEATPTSDTSSACEIASSRATDDSSVNGLSVSSLDSAGVDLQMPACSPGNTGSSPQNPTQFELGDQGDLFRCPVKEDDNNDKETNLANEGDDQKPKKADRRPALVPCLKVLADFLAQRPPPTGRKKHANPAAGDTGRASTVAEMDSDKTCVGAVVEVVRKTDADSAGKTDYSNDMDWRISHSEETEGLDIKSFQEPREADKRPLVPRVSLVRLPISFPPPGCPLPQFRLIPQANKQEVHLEQMPEEDQSAVGAAVPLSHPPRPPQARKVRCAVCREAGELSQCADCGSSFHADCHLTPVTDSDSWQCMVCEDLWEVKVHQSRVSEQDSALGLPDQSKCKRLFLTLISQKHSALLYRQPELLSPSSRYVDITLIRDRLLQKLSPAYLPSEFVSDVWLLLNSLQKSPEDIKPVAKLQRTFQKRLRKAFGSSLHPSLLESPPGEKVEGFEGGAEAQGAEEARQTMKRKRKEESVKEELLEPSMKKLCKDEEREGGME